MNKSSIQLGLGGCFAFFKYFQDKKRSFPPVVENNSKATLEHGEVELVPTENLHPCVLASLIWEGTLLTNKREVSTQPQTF